MFSFCFQINFLKDISHEMSEVPTILMRSIYVIAVIFLFVFYIMINSIHEMKSYS